MYYLDLEAHPTNLGVGRSNRPGAPDLAGCHLIVVRALQAADELQIV